MRKQYQVSYVVNGQEIWSEVFKADGYTDALKKGKDWVKCINPRIRDLNHCATRKSKRLRWQVKELN